jgi:endonuclease YncB( thermonuclease family)
MPKKSFVVLVFLFTFGVWVLLPRSGYSSFALRSDSEICEPSNSLIIVWKNHRAGYMSKNGKLVIEPKFKEAWPFSEGLARVDEDGRYSKIRWGYINKKGEYVIPPRFDDAFSFSEGTAAVNVDGKWGYINKKGEWAIKHFFRDASPFVNGLAVVAIEKETDENTVQEAPADWFPSMCTFQGQPDKWTPPIEIAYGHIDKSGNWVIPPQFEAAGVFLEGLAPVSVDGSNWGFISKNGKFVVEPLYDSVHYFHEGLAAFFDGEDEKWGYVNKQGQIAVEPRFDFAGEFADGIASAFYWDEDTEIYFKELASKREDGLSVIKIDADSEDHPMIEFIGWCGCIDQKGKFVFQPLRCRAPGNFSEGLLRIELVNGHAGYINTKGEWVIDPIFEYGTDFQNGRAEVEWQGKKFSINHKGDLIPIWSPRRRFEAVKATIKRVVDGDTIELLRSGSQKPELIDLWGIDCPELDQPHGERARYFGHICLGKQEVDCLVERNRKGMRPYGYIFYDEGFGGPNVSLSERLIEAGLAKWDRNIAPYDQDLEEAEMAARKSNLCIWSEDDPSGL